MFGLRRSLLSISLLTSLAFGCSDTVDSPDGEFDEVFVDGKADGSGYEECEVEEVVALLNREATTTESLRSGGVHTRAANNLIAHRDGEDGEAGTADDDLFDDIAEVDGVSYVGPAAIRQLVAMIGDACEVPDLGDPSVHAIFSPQPWEDSHLAEAVEIIDAAEHSVDIAMYSFRDASIFDAIERAMERGVPVRMIFESANGDRSDPEGTMSARLEQIGVDVRYINKIMHHKFVIADGPQSTSRVTGTIMTGSGNWSNSAGTRYDENTVIIRNHAELLLRYQQEYEHLWANSRDFLYETLPFVEAHEVDTNLLEAAEVEDAHAYFTSANFRTYESSRFGPTFSVNRGENEVADAIVARIESAERQILVASGHLRSRPISEAIIAAANANPDLEVRVYLDAQEFISEYSHDLQVEERNDCIAEAMGDEDDISDCYDRGFLYAYELVQAGIDVRFKYYSYRWHYSYAPQMHHKYLIIDDAIITGSYNLSDNAEHNTMENVLVLEGLRYADVVQEFTDNFNGMWQTASDTTLYDDLLGDVQEGDDEFPIVFDAMALTWEQVDVLKRAMRDACSEINSEDFRRNPQRHRTCDPSNN